MGHKSSAHLGYCVDLILHFYKEQGLAQITLVTSHGLFLQTPILCASLWEIGPFINLHPSSMCHWSISTSVACTVTAVSQRHGVKIKLKVRFSADKNYTK